jgi:hypothetical protein
MRQSVVEDASRGGKPDFALDPAACDKSDVLSLFTGSRGERMFPFNVCRKGTQ